MKIAIIGSGAMGSLFGGMLALAGSDVVLYDIFREHMETVAADGLAIEDAATGAVTIVRPRASAEPAAVDGADVLVIFVKSTATEAGGSGVRAARAQGCRRPHTAERAGQRGHPQPALRIREDRRRGHLAGCHVPGTRPHPPRRQGSHAHLHGGREE